VRHRRRSESSEAYTKAIEVFRSDRRQDHVVQPCTAENLLSSPTSSRIHSWDCTASWSSPMGLRACWSHSHTCAFGQGAKPRLPCIIANRAVPARLETRALEMATHLAGIAIERSSRTNSYNEVRLIWRGAEVGHTGSWAFDTRGLSTGPRKFPNWGFDRSRAFRAGNQS